MMFTTSNEESKDSQQQHLSNRTAQRTSKQHQSNTLSSNRQPSPTGILDDINRAETGVEQLINVNRVSPTVSMDMIDQRHAALQGNQIDTEAEEEDPALQEEKFRQILEKTKGLRDRLKEQFEMQSNRRDSEMAFEDAVRRNPGDRSESVNTTPVASIYNFLPVALLGSGSYGQVYLVQDINTGAKFAMKKLDKDKVIE